MHKKCDILGSLEGEYEGCSSLGRTPCSKVYSNFKMEAVRSSEKAIHIYQSTRRHIQECNNLLCTEKFDEESTSKMAKLKVKIKVKVKLFL
jgi:hypothetical protein